MKRIVTLILIFGITALFGCLGADEENTATGYTPAQLQAARSALPNRLVLTASIPRATEMAFHAVGDPAMYPPAVVPTAEGINTLIGDLLDILEQVTQLEPSIYDSAKQEFVWGPFDDDGSLLDGDTVYVWVKDHGADHGEDFRYAYGLFRGMGSDVATFVPVVWGGASPDPANEDHGIGVTLWDLENNALFEAANNPDAGELDEGRFAALYAKGEADDDSGAEVTIVVAAFRGFGPADAPADEEPGNLNYFWGGVDNGDERFDFLNFDVATDVDEDGSQAENLGIRMAFYNSGVGRAEVGVIGGDLPAGSHAEAVECWSASLHRQYLSIEMVDAEGTRGEIHPTEGEHEFCQMPSLDGVPSLDDVPADLLAGLDFVASNGIPLEDHDPEVE